MSGTASPTDAQERFPVSPRLAPAARLGLLLLLICSLAAALLLVSPPSSELVGTSNAQVPVISLVGPTQTARAYVRAMNNSGISGNIFFEDDGTRMNVTGVANGFVRERRYFTLVYGVKSKAPGEGGSPCGRDDTLNFEQMLIGEWLPASGTQRTLSTVVPKLTVGLEQIRTVSIRQLTAPLLPDLTQDFPPQAFELRSCGLIRRTN